MATSTKSLTYEAYLQLPECETGKEEVVDGEIRVMPPATLIHARTTLAFYRHFYRLLDGSTYEVLSSSFGIVVRREPLQVRNPDLAVFRRDKLVEKDGLAHSTPELVVEILSPSNSRKEMESRLADYRDLGVPEVWLASTEARTIETLALRDGDYRERRVFCEGRVAPAQLPEAAIEVGSVWE